MFKPVCLTLLMLLSLSFNSIGQTLDLGIQVGGGAYSGDLSTPGLTSYLQNVNPAVGGFLRVGLSRGITLRAGLLYTQVEAQDRNSGVEWRTQRDLAFSSRIFEGSIISEVHPLAWWRSSDARSISPYIFGGIGLFRFNPQANINGTQVDLQPLGTEGQGMPGYAPRYDLHGLVVPFGIGLRWESGKWIIDLEYGVRWTDTDYIDDVSMDYVAYDELLENNGALAAMLGNKIDAPTGTQRGNPDVNDWFGVAVLSFAYRLNFNNSRYIRGVKGRKPLDCPKF
ncbi:MAG: DUF6089 family protein [Saprospiraceae bacterium]|nr:DUF6089 family protein [Saprospiraceae bacterium]